MPLDPWIIEEIRRREEESRRREEESRERIEAPPPSRPEDAPPEPEQQSDRGVTIIDISGNDDDQKVGPSPFSPVPGGIIISMI